MIRQALVAGRFYPGRRETLLHDLEKYCTPRAANLRAMACLVPHAGYMYSGGVAGAVYAALDLPRRFVILAPDHYGRGASLGLHPAAEWETPLGRARVDTALGARIRQACAEVEDDEQGQIGRAHV